MFKKKTTIVCAAVAVIGFYGVAAPQAPAMEIVNDFGGSGWYSSDTRDSGGINLFGQNSTHPAYNTFNGGFVPGDDAKIAERIAFVDGPAGSLDGKGAVKLNATDQNAGKAHLSVLDVTTGFGLGSALVDPGFGVSYRYYDEPDPTSRTVSISISLTDNATNTSAYSFSYLGAPHATNVWIDESADKDSSSWRLFGNGALGAAPGGGTSQSLDDWAADGTFGDILTGDYTIYEVGFNLGSFARNENTYVDWFQSNLTNNGDMIDFQALQAPAAVPEPSTFVLSILGLLSLSMTRRRRQR